MNITLPQTDYYVYSLNRRVVDNLEISRLKQLIIEAIGRMGSPQEFLLDKEFFFSDGWAKGVDSEYSLHFHAKENVCIISAAIEKSNSYRPFSIFPLSDAHACCEYFVWLVSRGEVEINWGKFNDTSLR